MTNAVKSQIGHRLREKREQAGYTREQLGELCCLSPRFIANIELGDSTFSLDSLMTVCHALSCSSDYLLFGSAVDNGAWTDTIEKIQHLDISYQACVEKVLQGMIEAILQANSTE